MKTHFDERARDWDSDPMKVERARVVAEAIRAALPHEPGKTAIEIGCGTGLLSFFLQAEFSQITLADTSEGMLEVLSAKIADSGLRHLTPLRLDLSAGPAPASRFDVIYSLMLLHHIQDIPGILERFHALANPGGWLVICDLDAEDGTFHPPGASGIHFGFDRLQLQKEVEAAGFRHVRFSTVFVIHKNGRQYPLFLLLARKP